ncbi:bifunctional lysylphosphatidylglycerol flippase/synthetase MprF [Marinobacterium sp. YM272]|uniref:bifunctional lysylphosphatidylglycerol flippase/synthetase MprF n=1 Tax=Marinobacterium sp. YM272 TaxID=3421654 RepID=UPI003D7F9BF6
MDPTDTRPLEAASEPPRTAIGWLRHHASALVVFCLFVAGLVILFRTLHQIDVHQVRLELRSLSWRQIGLAALCTAGGYLALIGYDWSALRYIKRHLPLPLIAFTSFIGYALSNTIGVSWLSGGAVRYRIYSKVGLSGKQVALITAFCTLGFGIGEVLVGGTALVLQPELFAHYVGLAPGWVRWGGGLLLCVFVITLILRSQHKGVLTWRGQAFRLPETSILTGQVGFSVLDIGLAGTTLFLLLPDSALGLPGFLAIFAVALVIGVISHVPGGVGVFEAVMLNALAPFMPLEQATAGLFAYRIIYYLAPFLLGILLLILGETFLLFRRRAGGLSGALGETARITKGVISVAAPFALSGITFIAGALLLLGSSIPASPLTLKLLEDLFPLGVVELSHGFGGLLGAMLIVVSYGLWQRIRIALWLAAGLLSVGALISLIQTLDYDRAVIMILGLALIFVSRDQFFRRSRLVSELNDLRWLLLTLAAMGCFAGLLLFSFKQTAYQHELWWQFAITEQAPRGMRTAVIAATTFTLIFLFVAIRAPRYRPLPPSEADLEKALSVINAQDNPDANFALTRDKALLFSENSDAFVMFGVHGKNWVSMGDPVGRDEQDVVDLIWDFKAQASRDQGHATFYQVHKANIHHYIDANFTLLKLGEEALVELPAFSLEGSRRAKLRQADNRAKRAGLSFELLSPPYTEALLDELQAISDEWLIDKGVREKGFSLGFFDRAYLNRCFLAVVRENGQLSAFANVLVTATHHTATIDLMRHRNSADSSTMDYLFIELMLALKAQGYEWFSLGMAPLSGLMERASAPLWDRFGALIYKRGKRFYNFEGLRRFKEKFDPVWEPRYLAIDRRGVSPYLAFADIGALTSGGFSGMFRR